MPPPLAAGTAHTGLADGEVWLLAFRRLAVRTRQRSPNEAAVNRTFVVEGIDGVCLWRLLFNGWRRSNKRHLGL
jgi:hypothetical protein